MLETEREEIQVGVGWKLEISESWRLRWSDPGFEASQDHSGRPALSLTLAFSIRVQGCFSHVRIITYSQKLY